MDIFTVLFYQPIFNIIVVLYRLLGENLGLAIIAIALLSRIITIPITLRQIRMGEQSREMNAKIKAVKEKYKNNKEKQTQEMMKVQQEYLPGQLAGCLPILIQFVLLINVYNVIQGLFHNGAAAFANFAYSFVPAFAEGYQVNYNFFGMGLERIPSQVNEGFLALLPFLILALLVAVTQYFSTKILMGANTPAADTKAKEAKAKSNKKKGTPEDAPDFAELMQQSTKQTMIIFPVLLFIMSWQFPAGLSLYWTVQSGFVIIQQFLIQRFKPKTESAEKK